LAIHGCILLKYIIFSYSDVSLSVLSTEGHLAMAHYAGNSVKLGDFVYFRLALLGC